MLSKYADSSVIVTGRQGTPRILEHIRTQSSSDLINKCYLNRISQQETNTVITPVLANCHDERSCRKYYFLVSKDCVESLAVRNHTLAVALTDEIHSEEQLLVYPRLNGHDQLKSAQTIRLVLSGNTQTTPSVEFLYTSNTPCSALCCVTYTQVTVVMTYLS